MNSLSLLWRRGFASTNGPYRFIGNHAPDQILNAHCLQYCTQLLGDDCLCFTPLTLSKCFTNTQNRDESGTKRGSKLLCHKLIIFCIKRTALRMPHEHIAAADVLEHRSTDFSGMCA
ncbi:hypothetical protein D3C85_1326090 [compost metagenome]